MDLLPSPVPRVMCAAPFVAMEFDPFGNVQACCSNAVYPLGSVLSKSLHEIWNGARATVLRDAMSAHDFSIGCIVCRYRTNFATGEIPMEYYNEFPVDSATPEWPQLLSFSLHNTCNLECIMCGSDLSSRIRARRSDLAPLAHVYEDSFFEQLVPFLEHCTAVEKAGGEPFLVREHRRIWDALAELPTRPRIAVTTNGTIWNEHVEAILDEFDISLCVSVDGVTPETFESVRTGSSFDVVMANLERFHDYAESRGTGVFISFSMVRQNWFELGSVLRFADDRGIEVSVQTVIERDFGVQCLPTPQLEIVVETLEHQERKFGNLLSLNRDVWKRQVNRLRAELDERRRGERRPLTMEPPSADHPEHIETEIFSLNALDSGIASAELLAAASAELAPWVGSRGLGVVTVDDSGCLTAVDLEPVLPAGTELGPLVGRPLRELFPAIEAAVGGSMWIGEEMVEPDRVLHTLWYGSASRNKSGLVHRMISFRTPTGFQVVVGGDLESWSSPALQTRVELSVGGPRNRSDQDRTGRLQS